MTALSWFGLGVVAGLCLRPLWRALIEHYTYASSDRLPDTTERRRMHIEYDNRRDV